MTSQGNAARRPTTISNHPSSKTSRSFFGGLLAIALVLLTAGIGAFWYLLKTSPLALRASGDRPIALASAFVPANAPFAFSLLTNPDNLVSQQQASLNADPQAVLGAAEQIEQGLFEGSPINYDRDIRPWVGDEITVAYTNLDLDFDEDNGQQAGYLLALEIAPGRSQLAKESLQLFWQRQSLAGDHPVSEQLNGVRMLSALTTSQHREASIGAASALVGNQFVLFANDARVIRQSLRATETATNLAQSRAYRTAVEKLHSERLGLIHLSPTALNEAQSKQLESAQVKSAQSKLSDFVTVSLAITPEGIAATTQLPERPANTNAFKKGIASNSAQSIKASTGLLELIPAESAIAFTSQNLNQLESTIAVSGLPITLPDFLQRSLSNHPTDNAIQTEPSPWQWAEGDYAIAQTRSGQDDWILIVERTADGVAQIDEFAKSQGYNAAPLNLGEQAATAWTKLKTRASGSALETEILGLHLAVNAPPDQASLSDDSPGGYEIFASSIAAIEDALSAPTHSLLSDPKFVQSTVNMPDRADGNPESFLYLNGSAITSVLSKSTPLKGVESALRPITRQLDSLIASKSGATLDLSIQFKQSPSK